MQDTILNEFFAKNAETEPLPPLKMPSIGSFAQSLKLRLEIFALDVHDNLKHSLKTDAEGLQEQLEIQLNQLRYLVNDVEWFRWCYEKHKEARAEATCKDEN